jgi:hypothetical protein
MVQGCNVRPAYTFSIQASISVRVAIFFFSQVLFDGSKPAGDPKFDFCSGIKNLQGVKSQIRFLEITLSI